MFLYLVSTEKYAYSFPLLNFLHSPIRLKELWKQKQHLEFMWKTSATSSLFTHIFDSHYSAPNGFDWEYAFNGGEGGNAPGALSNPTLVIDSTSPFEEVNIGSRAEAFASEMHIRATYFRTNNLLVPHGDDFHYQVGKTGRMVIEIIVATTIKSHAFHREFI